MITGKDNVKRIRGDGLSVKLDSNDRVLEVTGDGCRITMGTNCGSVRVIGDGCRLKIARNTGDVKYTGDGGQVLLGPKSSKDDVEYIGDGGRVSVVTGRGTTALKNRRDSIVTREIENPSGKVTDEKFRIDEETDVECARRSSKNRDKDFSCVGERIENLLNERKETKKASRKRDVRTNAKIVTTVECDGGFVKKWFAKPESVVKSFGGGTFVKIEQRSSKGCVEVK